MLLKIFFVIELIQEVNLFTLYPLTYLALHVSRFISACKTFISFDETATEMNR